jgi:hypothetical protein
VNELCRVCESVTSKLFDHNVLGQHRVTYFACPQCDYVQTEEPYWLDSAYTSPLSSLDTGIVMRNLGLRPRVATLLWLTGNRFGQCIDVGGGCGLFTRLMRDIGFDYYWDDKYAQNVLARGFEAKPGTGPVALVSAFEVLEHTVKPLEFLRRIQLEYSPELILTSTEMFLGSAPPPDWQYYGFEHGQHIGFFSARTMAMLASDMKMHVTHAGMCQIFSRQPVPRALMSFAMSRAAHLLLPCIRKIMNSRVQPDYKVLVQSLRERD